MSLPLTVVILFVLFAVQSHGTARVAAFFGPITFVWFLAIAVAGGLEHRRQIRACSRAFNPVHGVELSCSATAIIGLLTLGAVFLVVTGVGGALCRSRPFRPRPIQAAWLCRRAARADC